MKSAITAAASEMAPPRDAPSPAQRDRDRAFCRFAAATGALAALPIWQSFQLGGSFDLGLTTAVIFAGIAWHLWRHVPPRREISTVAQLGAWLVLALSAWQLAWIGVDDFWFLRVAFVLWGAGCAVLWSGLLAGWRVVVALTLWAWCFGGNALLGGARMEEWISRRTAELAAWTLWQTGRDVSVDGVWVQTDTGGVTVGAPCTGLPLATLLLVLLTIATLLMHLPLRRWLATGALVVAGAFAIGVARVALLTVVSERPESFDYWHGPDGAAWFSAAGIVMLAWLIFRHREDAIGNPPPPTTPFALPAGLRFAWCPVVGATAAALLLGTPEPHAARASDAPAPRWGEATVAAEETQRFDLAGSPPQNRLAWRQDVTYSAAASAPVVHVSFGWLPVLISGEPRWLPASKAYFSLPAQWSRQTAPRGGSLWEARSANGRSWLATLTPSGHTVTEDGEWTRHLKAQRTDARWRDWLLHRRPLRDKSAYWLVVHVDDGDLTDRAATELLASAFSAWQDHAVQLSSTSGYKKP